MAKVFTIPTPIITIRSAWKPASTSDTTTAGTRRWANTSTAPATALHHRLKKTLSAPSSLTSPQGHRRSGGKGPSSHKAQASKSSSTKRSLRLLLHHQPLVGGTLTNWGTIASRSSVPRPRRRPTGRLLGQASKKESPFSARNTPVEKNLGA